MMKESGHMELSTNITAELNTNAELIGLELLGASAFIRDAILEPAQAKMLDSPKSYNNALSTDI